MVKEETGTRKPSLSQSSAQPNSPNGGFSHLSWDHRLFHGTILENETGNHNTNTKTKGQAFCSCCSLAPPPKPGHQLPWPASAEEATGLGQPQAATADRGLPAQPFPSHPRASPSGPMCPQWARPLGASRSAGCRMLSGA